MVLEFKIEITILFQNNILFFNMEKKAQNILEDRHPSNIELVVKIRSTISLLNS